MQLCVNSKYRSDYIIYILFLVDVFIEQTAKREKISVNVFITFMLIFFSILSYKLHPNMKLNIAAAGFHFF